MTDYDTRIVQVTVYPDRARLLRRGVVELNPGIHTLEIPELPLSLDPDSVRAAGRGPAGTRLLGVRTERVHYRESPADRVRELEKEIQSLEDQETVQQNQASVLQAQLANLRGLTSQTETFAKGLAFGRTQVSDLTDLIDYAHQQESSLLNDLLQIEIAGRDLAKTLDKLRHELDHLSGARPRRRFVAKIDLDVPEPGQIEVDLIYTLKNASWQPLYDLRLWEASEQREKPYLETGYLAQVQQSTGEDWNDVELILSTARPAVSGMLPDLDPWYLDVHVPRPTPAPQRLRAKSAAPGMMDDFTAGTEPEAAEALVPQVMAATPATATIDTTGTAVTFHIAGRTTVPSDGESHKTTIAIMNFEPKLDYVAAPKLADAVFRRAKVTNSSDAILLPGPANVFAGGEFIGRTEFEHIAPNEEFELGLGIDDRLKVERKLVAREVDKSLIGDKRRLHYAYQIEVENLRPVTEKITVSDHYPVPRHEGIRVRLESVNPEPSRTTELHLLEWVLDLASGRKETLRFDVYIEHPRSLSVSGLPD
jgi:uncharacterized protein (TIGR02231 family)